jgi:hypothetical protein
MKTISQRENLLPDSPATLPPFFPLPHLFLALSVSSMTSFLGEEVVKNNLSYSEGEDNGTEYNHNWW